MGADNRSSRDDAAFADLDAGEDDALPAYPYSIANDDGADIFRIGRFVCPPRCWIRAMGVGVHDCDVTREKAVASDGDQFPYSESTTVADSGIVPDLQSGSIGEAGRKCKADFAVYRHIVADNDNALA